MYGALCYIPTNCFSVIIITTVGNIRNWELTNLLKLAEEVELWMKYFVPFRQKTVCWDVTQMHQMYCLELQKVL
jgi:hypothetical protein